MHLGNEAVTLECAAFGCAVASLGVGYSGWLARRATQSSLLKAAALGSLVFAAQMLNVPVLAIASAHFVGGVLLAELLGPALGVLTMSTVLLLQAVLLSDGGLAALGINVLNMALLPTGTWLLVRRAGATRWLSLSAASMLSIAGAVLLIAGEVAWGRSSSELAQWSSFVASLALNHLPVLGLEAILSVSLVVLWQRLESTEPAAVWRLPSVTIATALLLLAIALTLSSSLPDGYESAAQAANMEWLLAAAP